MSYQDHGAPLGRQTPKQSQNQLARVGIEVAGRLVGSDNLGSVDQSPGNGHALLLTAGKLIGAILEAVA